MLELPSTFTPASGHERHESIVRVKSACSLIADNPAICANDCSGPNADIQDSNKHSGFLQSNQKPESQRVAN